VRPPLTDRAAVIFFLALCYQMLCKPLVLGEVVIMGNLLSCKITSVRSVIEAVGVSTLYLPLNSLSLNPVELIFWQNQALSVLS